MENQVTALALPDEATFKRDIQAINRFQQVVHSTMVRDLDYGIIPGTQKPTLLKPGAEKIAKLLGLSDQYEIMDRSEEWQQAFFRYLIKCRLVHVATGDVISEGLGECNSMESKYRYRWVGERDLPSGVDKSKLVSQERRSKTGGHWTVYRLDNDDIYSLVNTILKMAKKRALVDAALSAGRLSDVFTQDIEDIPGMVQQEEYTTESAAQRARKEQPTPAKKAITPEEDWDSMKREEAPEPPAPAPESTGKTDSEKTVDLASLEFKNPGEFYTACLKHFKLSKTQTDKEISMYDLSKTNQRAEAWKAIVAIYGQKRET